MTVHMMSQDEQMDQIDVALDWARANLDEAANWAKACGLFPFAAEIDAARVEVARLLRAFHEDRTP